MFSREPCKQARAAGPGRGRSWVTGVQLESSHSLIPGELWGVNNSTDLSRLQTARPAFAPCASQSLVESRPGRRKVSSQALPCKNRSQDEGATTTQKESTFSHPLSSREEAAAHARGQVRCKAELQGWGQTLARALDQSHPGQLPHKGSLPLPLHRPSHSQVSPASLRIDEGPCKPLKVTSSGSCEEGKHRALKELEEVGKGIQSSLQEEQNLLCS